MYRLVLPRSPCVSRPLHKDECCSKLSLGPGQPSVYQIWRKSPIGEKLRPLALTKDKIPLLRKSATAHAHWINPFWLEMVQLMQYLFGSLWSKSGEDLLKIEGAIEIIDCTDFDAIRALQTNTHTHTHTLNHVRTLSDFIFCPIPCTWTGQTIITWTAPFISGD